MPLVFIALILSYMGCERRAVEFSFAYLTDIHVQPELNATKGYKKPIDVVNELNPEFVITGGDLIMDALGVPYERADMLYSLYNQTTRAFKMPVYNTIGNHEIFGLYVMSGVDTNHPKYYKKLYEDRVGKRYYSFDYKGWHFMLLDSIGQTVDRKYVGWIDAEQMEWIASDLQSISPDVPIVLSTHIPFISVARQLSSGSTEANPNGLVVINSKDVLGLFQDRNLKLVLQGHLHFLEEINVRGITFLTGGAVSGNWWEGPRQGMEEGFVLVTVKGQNFHWEYVDFGWEVQKTEN